MKRPTNRRRKKTISKRHRRSRLWPPIPVHNGADLDLAYGAFQRGYFLTAFALATDRVNQKSDPKAMTLLGELYAAGLGVPQDDKQAEEWYRARRRPRRPRGDVRAGDVPAARPRRPARPRGGRQMARRRRQARPAGRRLQSGASLHRGPIVSAGFQSRRRTPSPAADAGSPEAQYALGTFYKQGRGVPKDPREAARLWSLAALADNTDAEVEYAIALFNGDGVAKNEAAAAALFRKAALHGSAIARTASPASSPMAAARRKIRPKRPNGT